MLTFAVVVSSRGGAIPGGVLEHLRDRACAGVPFDAAHHLVWANESGTVWFGGWQNASDAPGPEHHWHVDDGLTAFTDHVWPRRDGWQGSGPWAAQLAQHFRREPMTDGSDDLAGVYIAVSLPDRGRGSIGADPLGIGLVYLGQGRDIIVISSRAALAAELLAAERRGPPKRDAIGAGWIAFANHRATSAQTGFDQVTVMPPGAVVDIDPAGGARLVYPSPPPWRRLLDDTMSPEAALEEVGNEMTSFTRTALSLPGQEKRMGLTGGKDSRLILALLVADGTARDVQYETFGKEDLPDVIVAKQIAELLGLRHVVNPGIAETQTWRKRLQAAVRDQGYGDISSRELAIRLTAWACSGSQSAFAPHLGRPPSRNRGVLIGLFGETFRGNFVGSIKFQSKARAANFLKFGSAGILRPEVSAHYREESHRMMFDDCLERDSPQDVVDTWYMRHWLRRWFGQTQEIDPEGRMFPLYSTTAIRLAFTIGAENRHAGWISYQLMRRACPPLVDVPFAGKGWSAGADRGLTKPRRYREPAPAAPSPASAVAEPLQPSKPASRTVKSDMRERVLAEDLDIMRRFLRYDPLNPVFEVLDPVATQVALDNFERLPEPHRLQLFGALTAAIWLGGYEIELPRSVTTR